MSSFIASSKPELSITPPIISVFSVFVNTVIFFAHESNANFPIPLRPINGRPKAVFEILPFRLEYPIFKNLF